MADPMCFPSVRSASDKRMPIRWQFGESRRGRVLVHTAAKRGTSGRNRRAFGSAFGRRIAPSEVASSACAGSDFCYWPGRHQQRRAAMPIGATGCP